MKRTIAAALAALTHGSLAAAAVAPSPEEIDVMVRQHARCVLVDQMATVSAEEFDTGWSTSNQPSLALTFAFLYGRLTYYDPKTARDDMTALQPDIDSAFAFASHVCALQWLEEKITPD